MYSFNERKMGAVLCVYCSRECSQHSSFFSFYSIGMEDPTTYMPLPSAPPESYFSVPSTSLKIVPLPSSAPLEAPVECIVCHKHDVGTVHFFEFPCGCLHPIHRACFARGKYDNLQCIYCGYVWNETVRADTNTMVYRIVICAMTILIVLSILYGCYYLYSRQ
jgi:hypothetical protein